MSILDATLARTSGPADSVIGLARDMNLDAAKVEKTIMVLARNYGRSDTVGVAAAQTGYDTDTLGKIVTALGGDSAVGEVADELSIGLRTLGQGDLFKELF